MRSKFKTKVILLREVAQQTELINVIVQLPFDYENPLQITIAEKPKGRTNEQNKLYWQILQDISEQKCVNNKFYSAEIWAEFFKSEYLPINFQEIETKKNYKKWTDGVSGNKILVGSTTQLTTVGFTNYIDKIILWASENKIYLTPF